MSYSKFKDFLAESKLTTLEAESILGLVGSYTSADELKAYRTASSANHPDKGGNVETMKQINLAHTLLKGKNKSDTSSVNSGKFDWAASKAKYKAMAAQINLDILAKYQPDAFLKYFNELFGKTFTHKLVITDSEYFAGFKSVYTTEDGKIAFDFDVSIYLADIFAAKNNSLTSNEDISYTLSVTAYGYSNRKKQKMSQRDWKQMNNHSVLFDPSKAFSPAKMKKMVSANANTKMKRADFALGLKNEVKVSSWNSDSYLIPLADGNSLLISRMVFNRMPTWSINRIGKKQGYKFVEAEGIERQYASFMEDSETLDLFVSFKKMNAKQVNDVLIKLKKKRGY